MKGKGNGLWKAVGLGALGALAVGAFFLMGSFRNYAESFGAGPAGSSATVLIQNPQPGSKFEQGAFVQVETKATGPIPIVGLELWADGELAGVQSAPTAQGLSPLAGNFDWQSDEPGTHLLFARAVDKLGMTTTSDTLEIEIVEDGQVPADQADYVPPAPVIPADLGGGGGAADQGSEAQPPYAPVDVPAAPPPGGETETYKLWSPSIGGWLEFVLFKPKPPTAPAIPASAVEVCAPRIWISDNSTNEDGFYVYRRDPGMVNFHKIATLAAHVGNIFTYDDSYKYGTYFYFVSAFNAAGEAPSNIVKVVVDSPNCKPKGSPGLTIKLSDIKFPIGMKVEKGYCYVTFDNANWSRLPEDPESFLPAVQDGSALIGPGAFASFSQEGKPEMLALECWGWNGGGLQKIGTWHFDGMAPKPAPDPQGGGTNPGLEMVDANVDPSLLDLKYDYRIPKVSPIAPATKQGCFDYIGIPNPFLAGLICGALPPTQGITVWNVQPSCPAMKFNPSVVCFTEQDIVGYRVYDTHHDNGKSPITTINAPAKVYIVADWGACEARYVKISALVEANGEILEGVPSYKVYFPPDPQCGYWLGQDPRRFEVTWDSIDFSVGNIDDGVDIEDDAEGYGYLAVSTQSQNFLTFFNLPHQEFEDDSDNNPYFFTNLLLQKNTSSKCNSWNCPFPGGMGQNSVIVPVLIGDQLGLRVYLIDHDPDSPDDVLCSQDTAVQNLYFSAQDIDQAGGTLTDSRTTHHNNASCKVTFTIKALP